MKTVSPLQTLFAGSRSIYLLGFTLLGLSIVAACGGVAADSAPVADDSADAPTHFLSRLLGGEPERQPLTVATGTRLRIRLNDSLSSHSNHAGDSFSATLAEPVIVDGETALASGTRVLGTVTQAEVPKIGGRAKLSLRFDSVEAGGEPLPLDAVFAASGKSERMKDAAIIGGGTIVGAVLGDEVEHGEGGVLGAVAGGIAGALGAKKTQGKPVVVPAGSELTLELRAPVTVRPH